MNGRRTVEGRLDLNVHESPFENLFIPKYYHDDIYGFAEVSIWHTLVSEESWRSRRVLST